MQELWEDQPLWSGVQKQQEQKGCSAWNKTISFNENYIDAVTIKSVRSQSK